MPCSGPNRDYAVHQGEEAFEKIMALLKEEYCVNNWDMPEQPNLVEGEQASNIQRAIINMHKASQEDWNKQAELLKQAVIELIWSQHCMDF